MRILRHAGWALLLWTACAGGARPPCLVRDVIGRARHGERVQVFGYVNLRFEYMQIGRSEVDVGLLIRPGPWLVMADPAVQDVCGWGLVEGVVDTGCKGHGGFYPFALREARIVRLYPGYKPDYRDFDAVWGILFPMKDKDSLTRDELNILRTVTGHDAGSTAEEWRQWLGDSDNAWRNALVDRATRLPAGE